MSHTRLTVALPDGVKVEAELILPAAGAVSASSDKPLPLVILYPDAFGPRPAMTAIGERIAAGGYAVLCPDPFLRQRPFAPFDPKTAFGDDTERARLMALLGSIDFTVTHGDTRALVDALATDARVDTSRVGVIGHCMGGRFALLSAIAWPDRVAAAVSVHGGGLVTPKPDSPHLRLAGVTASLSFAVADHDTACTAEMQETLKKALSEAGIDFEMALYPEALHGFGVPDTAVFDEAATARYLENARSLFDRKLRGLPRAAAGRNVPSTTERLTLPG